MTARAGYQSRQNNYRERQNNYQDRQSGKAIRTDRTARTASPQARMHRHRALPIRPPELEQCPGRPGQSRESNKNLPGGLPDKKPGNSELHRTRRTTSRILTAVSRQTESWKLCRWFRIYPLRELPPLVTTMSHVVRPRSAAQYEDR